MYVQSILYSTPYIVPLFHGPLHKDVSSPQRGFPRYRIYRKETHYKKISNRVFALPFRKKAAMNPYSVSA